MSLPFFIAKKLYGGGDSTKRISRPAVLIAILGVAIGLAIMIVTVAVVVGFKKEVSSKVVGFGSHIQVHNFDAVKSFETHPVLINDSLMELLSNTSGIKHIQRYSTKSGILKTDDDFQGMVLKGVAQEYDMSFFRQHLLEGEIPHFTDSTSSHQVLVSKTMADKLHLELGDKVNAYFIQNQVRVRPLTVAGIYQTNVADYDATFLVTDMYTVGRLNQWKEGQVSGAEIQVKDFDQLEDITYDVGLWLNRVEDCYGGIYYVQSIVELNPQIFGWLDLLDVNVWVILFLMMGVAGFTMISGLLIMIIERTQMIGLLKAMGSDNWTVRKVFLWLALFLIGRGMLIGNIIGLSFYFLQRQFRIFKLDPQNYYVDFVPVSFSFGYFLLINVVTLIVAVLMLVGPSCLITKIHPARSMRYE